MQPCSPVAQGGHSVASEHVCFVDVVVVGASVVVVAVGVTVGVQSEMDVHDSLASP